ncbi:46297_t:CDS:2, partial [Gigaspora margarita]
SIPASSHGVHLYKSGAKTKVTCGDSRGPVFYFLDLHSVSLIGINTAAFVINDTTFAINAVLPLEIILAKTKLKLVTIN